MIQRALVIFSKNLESQNSSGTKDYIHSLAITETIQIFSKMRLDSEAAGVLLIMMKFVNFR